MTITTQTDHAPGGKSRQIDEKMLTAATVLGGAVMAAFGISRRSWRGAAFAAGGGYLIYHGITQSSKPYTGKVRVAQTINQSPDDVYKFIRDTANFPKFFQGLKTKSDGENGFELSLGNADSTVISNAEITDEENGKHIAWGSTGGPLKHRGVVHFHKAPDDRGTELAVALEFEAPAGPIARAVALFAGWDPEQLVREALRNLKQLMEAGEIPTTRGQPVGARGLKGAALRVLYRETPAQEPAKVRLAGD